MHTDNDKDISEILLYRWAEADKVVSCPNVTDELSQFHKLHPTNISSRKDLHFRIWMIAAIIVALLIVSGIYGVVSYNRSSHGKSIAEQRVVVPRKQMRTLHLPDGSIVKLNAGSRLVILNNFGKTDREVYLEGEAMFNVAHDAAHPFIVKSKYLTARVLGTRFTMRAYSRTDAMVVLAEGSVEVSDGSHKITLAPSEKVSVNSDGVLDVSKESNVEGETEKWEQGKFSYSDASFEEIMLEISRWYGVKVKYENEGCRTEHIHFEAERSEGLTEIIDNLNAIGVANIVISNNCIIVK